MKNLLSPYMYELALGSNIVKQALEVCMYTYIGLNLNEDCIDKQVGVVLKVEGQTHPKILDKPKKKINNKK